MTSLLITGGAGFIGSNFVRYLLASENYEISVIDSLGYAGNLQNLKGCDVRFIKGDIRNPDLVKELVRGSDHIVHFAAESHNDNSLKDPSPFIETNILGTFNILEAVRFYDKRFHHISTDEVFGDLPIENLEKFSESSAYNPSSPYSATKAASDLLVKAWIRSYGIAATLSNCSNNYGPYQHPEKFIPRQVTNLLQGMPAKVFGDGKNVRDWIHVDDHSSALVEILKSGLTGESYLIGAACEKNNLEVIQTILELLGRDPNEIEFVGDRVGHDLRYAIDNSKIRTELGWEPKKIDFASNLSDVIDWYRSNSEWWLDAKLVAERQYKNGGQ